MTARFDICRAFTMREEGAYSTDRLDAGNWFNHSFVGCYAGVTAGALVRCYGPGFARGITADMMRNLPASRVYDVYLSYWAGMGCELLPRGLDLMTFDFGYNSGERSAVILLQQTLGFPVGDDPRTAVDGFTGAATAAHAAGSEPHGLIHDLYEAQCGHYAGLAAFPRYGAAWLDRTARRRDAALALIASS